MFTPTTRVVGVDPDMTRDQWVASLAGTPSAGDAAAAYDALLPLRVSFLFMRWIFTHESSDGTKGICPTYDTKSPGNCRSSSTGVGYLVDTNVEQTVGGKKIPPAGKNKYVRYPSWVEGWRDAANRLIDPDYPYAQKQATTIEKIIPIWAPPTDGNNPASYIAAVVRGMNEWLAENGMPMPANQIRIAILTGHHNTSGGNALEYKIVGELAEEYGRQFKAAGFDCRVFTPDGPDPDLDPGDGDFKGDLYEAARQVVPWRPHLFLEVHTEGAGGRRGVFFIYPDWGSDIDTDVRDRLGPMYVNAIAAATGLPLRGSGGMSEKATGVGGQGYRLGVFRATEELAADCTRLIIEHGAHDSAADLAIIQAPGFNAKVAAAVVKATAQFYGVTTMPTNPPTEKPPVEPDVILLNGHALGHGFLTYWRKNGGLAIFGLPITEEIKEGDLTVQYFERARFEHHPNNPPEWQVLLGRLGVELTEARKEVARLTALTTEMGDVETEMLALKTTLSEIRDLADAAL